MAAPVWGYKTGPDPGFTNAPGEDNCTACHVGTALNAGGGSVKVELVGATTYSAGAKHTLRVTLADATASRWGFELSARLTGTANKAGTFSLKDPVNTRRETVPNGLEYVTHTEPGTMPGMAGPASWDVEWTAPPSGAGSVTFYVAGNAANRDGAITGDKIYAASTVVLADSTPVLTKSYALPQIAFGGNPAAEGRWSTALYFTNTGPSTTGFTVDFYNNDGTPMAVPVVGGTATSVPVTVAQGATAQIQITSAGALTQGWASVILPAEVKGFGIFRQSVTGREDQEAVVPVSDDSKQSYVLIWDDSGFDTAMAVANPGDTPVTVSMTVRVASGNQIGTGSINLGPKQKAAFVIRTQLNLPSMQGVRGAMDITVSSGKLALLGLRFGPVAFTSMPPAEK